MRDFRQAALDIAQATLGAMIGDMVASDVVFQRELIKQTLRTKLVEATERWGVKVTAVEIREMTSRRV